MPWQPKVLAALRKRRKLTQQALADATHSHRVTIARLESGDLQPGIDALEALAKALRCSVLTLLRPMKKRQSRRRDTRKPAPTLPPRTPRQVYEDADRPLSPALKRQFDENVRLVRERRSLGASARKRRRN